MAWAKCSCSRGSVGSRTVPTPVAGPVGVTTVVDGFNLAYRLDSHYRLAHHGPEVANLDGAGAEAFEFELGDGPTVVFEAENLKITVFKVDHDPVLPSVGYRFDYHDRSIVISGDTNVNWGGCAGRKRRRSNGS